MMRLALFGATGKTGRLLVDRALAEGHEVAALVRDPAKLPPRTGLRVEKGDARERPAAARTLQGADAAILLLGNFNRRPNSEISDATRTICDAMAGEGPRRLVAVTTIGVGDSLAPMKSLLFKLVIRTFARHIWADRARQEEVVRASGLDWTIVRPGGLTDGRPTGRWRAIGGGDPQPAKVEIARADLAAFLLGAVDDRALVGRTLCLFTPRPGA